MKLNAPPWPLPAIFRLLSPTALVAVVITGCSSGAATGPVSGIVTLDGGPAGGVLVTFQPLGEEGDPADLPRSSGVTDAEGRYSLRFSTGSAGPGAIIGRHEVRFSIDEFAEDAPRRIPESSRTRRFDVPPGGSEEANFDL